MCIPGVPYSEPAFSSVDPIDCTTDLKAQEVIGLAYLITTAQYLKVIESEGGGIAYADVELDAEPITDDDENTTGSRFKVRTLQGTLKRIPAARPSPRYMVCAMIVLELLNEL